LNLGNPGPGLTYIPTYYPPCRVVNYLYTSCAAWHQKEGGREERTLRKRREVDDIVVDGTLCIRCAAVM
jgi:hypothetical protein